MDEEEMEMEEQEVGEIFEVLWVHCYDGEVVVGDSIGN
jgi:hypothetical protein